MPPAGKYDTRLDRLVFREPKGTDGGGQPTWTDEGDTYWCWVEWKGATSTLIGGVLTTVTAATVHVNGFPDLEPKDRLRMPGSEKEVAGVITSMVFECEQPVEGDEEWVVDAQYYRAETPERG